MVHRRAGPGMIVQQEVMVESKEKCKREEKTLRATIERGMPDGEEIVFKYDAEQKPGQIPGDVVVKLKTVNHPTFKRNRETLSMKMTIPLRAALLGFETAFQHLDGHTVTIKRSGVTKPNQASSAVCPACAVGCSRALMPSGCKRASAPPSLNRALTWRQVVRIKNEGMPKHSTPSEAGDLIITFAVDFPKTVDADLAAGLQELLPQFSAADVRISAS